MEPTPMDIARFWMKFVEEDHGYVTPCWIWSGATNGRYGQFYIKGGPQKATRTGRIYTHRFAYFLATGQLLRQVCHKCDVPLCGRMDHLFDGSQADNLADARLKGRTDKKLTEATRERIARRHILDHEKQRDLADEYGVARSLISAIVKRYRPHLT